jgi:hypothetical protein
MNQSPLQDLINLFSEFGTDGLTDDLINIYLVFMGVRPACLISNINYFYATKAYSSLRNSIELYQGLYPYSIDYPLVCLRNSWVSASIKEHLEMGMKMGNARKLSDNQIGMFLGFLCYDDQNWGNPRITRYSIEYSLESQENTITPFMIQVCSKTPSAADVLRMKFKAIEMQEAMKLINDSWEVSVDITVVDPMSSY